MEMKLQYHILDARRREMLPRLAAFKNDFYLAGGTGLALQIGHRISEDYDFFTDKEFENAKLINKLTNLIDAQELRQIQNEENALTVMMDSVKISFFCIEKPPLLPLVETEYLNIASISEIGIFKLIALLRAAYKDYVDLYFILNRCELRHLFELAKKKYHSIDTALYLKALLSYDDVDLSPILYAKGYETSHEVIFSYIQGAVQQYLAGAEKKKYEL